MVGQRELNSVSEHFVAENPFAIDGDSTHELGNRGGTEDSVKVSVPETDSLNSEPFGLCEDSLHALAKELQLGIPTVSETVGSRQELTRRFVKYGTGTGIRQFAVGDSCLGGGHVQAFRLCWWDSHRVPRTGQTSHSRTYLLSPRVAPAPTWGGSPGPAERSGASPPKATPRRTGEW